MNMLNRLFYSSILFPILVLISCSQKDVTTGIQREYFADGTLKTERTMKDGIEFGPTKSYNYEGKLVKRVDYVNGIIDGKSVTYNPKTGLPIMSVSYKNAIQDGPFLQYYVDGKVYREMNYLKGKGEGIFKAYWSNGKIKASCPYHCGFPGIGLQEWDESGTLIIQPFIVVEKINQLALLNTYMLKIKISNKTDKVHYYYDNLIDGKYLPWGVSRIVSNNGELVLQYQVLRGVIEIKNIGIVAKVKTDFGSELILRKNISFTINNAF